MASLYSLKMTLNGKKAFRVNYVVFAGQIRYSHNAVLHTEVSQNPGLTISTATGTVDFIRDARERAKKMLSTDERLASVSGGEIDRLTFGHIVSFKHLRLLGVVQSIQNMLLASFFQSLDPVVNFR
jgi:hypothetical protein